MDEIKSLKAGYERALRKRQPWESGYQDCYDYALPGRSSFFLRTPGTDAPEIYDETAVIAVQEFASRIQAGMIPNYSRWSELEAGSEVPPEDRVDTNKQLDDVTDYVMGVINNSNFAQEANEFLIDIAIGTACMEVHEGDAVNPVVFNAVPLPELALDTGPKDELEKFFRSRAVRVSMLERCYPGAKVPAGLLDKVRAKAGQDQDDPLVSTVLAVWRDPKAESEEVTELRVFLPEHDEIIKKATYRGTGSNPYIGSRWSKAAGEVWGRGPLFNTMPAVRTANLVVQMVLENAEMAIAGIYTAEDDGVVSIDNIRLLPGTVIPVAPGSNGLQAVRGAGDFDVSQLVLSEMRANIRKALYNETLGSPDTTPMSATEVAQRMADLSRQIGSAFGRLQVEFVNKVIQRVIYILKKQGRIDIPVVNGREIKIKSTSPLAQAQAVEDINAVNNYLTLMNQHFGPQVTNMMVDQGQTADYLRAKFGVPERINRDEKQRAELAQQAMQMQQGMMGEQGGGAPAEGLGA